VSISASRKLSAGPSCFYAGAIPTPERKASLAFLEQVLRPGKDHAFAAHFDTRVEVVQGFTSSRQDLEAALHRLSVPTAVATLLYEAIRQASEDMMRPRQGRKAFILLSDGVSFRDKTTIGTAIHAMAGNHGKSVMQRLARETGGTYFEPG
jgi:hypothetical protein